MESTGNGPLSTMPPNSTSASSSSDLHAIPLTGGQQGNQPNAAAAPLPSGGKTLANIEDEAAALLKAANDRADVAEAGANAANARADAAEKATAAAVEAERESAASERAAAELAAAKAEEGRLTIFKQDGPGGDPALTVAALSPAALDSLGIVPLNASRPHDPAKNPARPNFDPTGIWLVQPTIGAGVAFIVTAPSEEAARAVVAGMGRKEGANYWGDPAMSECLPLTAAERERVVMRHLTA